MIGSRSRTNCVALAILTAGLLTAGCGTRVAEEEARPVAATARPGHAGSQPGTDPRFRPDVQAATDGVATAPTVGSATVPMTGPRSSSANEGPANQLQSKSPERRESGAPAGSSSTGQPSLPSGPSTAPGTGPRSPILMASVGTYAGLVGTIFKPILEGAQLWVSVANAKGGVNGHQIKLIVYDDGGDPARHRAQVQEAVERKGVIGFFLNAEAISGASTVGYLEAKRIPVVGISLGEFYAYDSPMYFPQASAADELVKALPFSIAHQLIPRGKKRLGTIICVEAEFCDTAERLITEVAQKTGLEHVYRGRASLAQPDFTAECLSARNQNVEILAIGLDQNSVNRVTVACARQGYHPTYSTNIIVDQHKDNPELAGAVGETIVFPWFQSGTPATDEFQAAVRAYGGGLVLGVGTAAGWTAGKLLERVARTMSEPPTTEQLLEGLWAIKGDTLGGLTAPLTFIRDKPPPRVTCWFDLTIVQRAWISPDGFTLHCDD